MEHWVAEDVSAVVCASFIKLSINLSTIFTNVNYLIANLHTLKSEVDSGFSSICRVEPFQKIVYSCSLFL